MIACETAPESAVLNRVLSFSANQDMSVGSVPSTVSFDEARPCEATSASDVLALDGLARDMASAFLSDAPPSQTQTRTCDDHDDEVDAASERRPGRELISDGYSEVDATIDTEVVYVKENVWVWPSQKARIMGRLTLTRQHRVLFLSWLPYATGVVKQLADLSVKRLQKYFFPDFDMDEVQQEMSMNTAMAELVSNGPLNRARRQLCQMDRLEKANMSQVATEQVVREEESRAERLSSAADLRQATTTVGVFEIIEQTAVSTSGRSAGQIAPPLEMAEWASFMDEEGRITDPAGFKERVYESGVSPELRKEVWKFLLGLYPIDSTARQRGAILKALCEEYEAIKQQWVSITPKQAAHWAKWRERRAQIEKDVLRTDRDVSVFSCRTSALLGMMQSVLLSYVMYDQDLGYSQGMSDLLAPLLFVTRNEAEAFWCFVKLMERVGGNFDNDQRCVQLQLGAIRQLVQLLDPPMHEAIKRAGCLDYLCCFRWVMVVLKREFVFDDVQRLWEVLWTNPFTPHFHLYVAVVMLEYRRAHILDQELDYATMHQICNQLRGKLDLKSVLADAEALCKYAGDAGLAVFADVPTFSDSAAPLL